MNVLFPAYGRSYETLEQAVADFEGGKDFRWRSPDGPYCSCRDLVPHQRINFKLAEPGLYEDYIYRGKD